MKNSRKAIFFYLCRNYLNQDQGESVVRVYQFKSGNIVLINVFYLNQLTIFLDYVKTFSKQQALIIIESEDAIISEEKIPYLLGFDRLAIIKRKAKQILNDETMVHYYSKGRSKEHDRQETIIFLGIGDSSKWNPWILAIRDTKLLIKAVTIPAFACSSFHLNWKSSPNNNELFIQIAWNYGGLSQTVLARGLPIFSRFFPWLKLPFSDDVSDLNNGWNIELAYQECINQTQKLMSFLQGQGIWSPNQPSKLSIVIPANLANAKIEFPEVSGIVPNIVIAPTQIDNRKPLKPKTRADSNPNNLIKPINYGAETLFIDSLSSSKKVIQCAPDDIRYRYLSWLMMRYSSSVILVLLLFFLLVVGYLGFEVGYRIYNNKQSQVTIDQISSRYNELREQFPKIGINNDQLRQIIYLTDGIEKCHPHYPNFIEKLAKINTNHPQIEFKAIKWNQQQTYNPGLKSKDLIGSSDINCQGQYIINGYIVISANNTQRDLEKIYNAWLNDTKSLDVQIENSVSPLNTQSGKYSENNELLEQAEFEVIVSF